MADFGTRGDDVFDGTDGPDEYHGRAGADTITGYLGDDILVGNRGPDRITVSGGRNMLYGGHIPTGEATVLRNGADRFVLHVSTDPDAPAGEAVIVDNATDSDQIDTLVFDTTETGVTLRISGDGDDLVVELRDGDGALRYTATIRDQFAASGDGLGVERLVLRTGDGIQAHDIAAAANPGEIAATVLYGATAGPDAIDANPWADWISGLDGDDVIFGRDGADTLSGGAGDDEIHGGRGRDLVYGDGGDDLIHGGPRRDTLYGGDGNDTLYGGRSGDQLYGDDGDDVLYGGGASDHLHGGAGNDIIVANETGVRDFGRVNMWGGEGSDIFVLNESDWFNYIYDFESTGDDQDVLDVSGLSKIEDFDDLMENHLNNGKNSIVLKANGATYLLVGADFAGLDEDNFLF